MPETLDSEVYEDFRGKVIKYRTPNMEFIILMTNEGMMRGGDFHDTLQNYLILEGQVEVTMRQNDQDIISQKGTYETIVMPANTPHIIRSLTRSVMIRYGKKPGETRYYEPYRDLIRRQFDTYKK